MKNPIFIIVLYTIGITHVFAQSKSEMQDKVFEADRLILQLQNEVKDKKLQIQVLNQRLEELKLKLYEQKGNSAKEISSIQQKLDACTNSVSGLYKKGYDLFEKGELEDAMEVFNSLINGYPASEEAKMATGLLVKIKADLDEMRKAEALQVAKENLIVTRDEFRKRTYYKDKRGQRYYYSSSNENQPDLKLNLYFSIPDNYEKSEQLRLEIGYRNKNWLFVHKVTFLIGETIYEINQEFIRDHTTIIYEWTDRPVVGRDLALVKAMINADLIKVRFTGDKYYYDVIVHPEQTASMKNIYDLYKQYGGN